MRWVNAPPNPATEPAECTAAPYPTIATALAAASDGDIIRLCEGQYAGGVTIDKRVTIEGRAEAARGDIVVTGSSDGLIVDTDGVTIQHLTLDGPGAPVIDDGIVVNAGSDDTTISDVEVKEWQWGIRVDDSTDTLIEDINVHDNTEDGVELINGERNVVRDNEIKDNGDSGVSVDGEDEALVEGNILSGNDDEQILISFAEVYVRIYRNQIDTTSDGIYLGTVPAEAFIQIGGSPENANSFSGPFGDPDYYVQLLCGAENTVDATYNWWGATARADIANRIFNDEDDPTPGVECPAPDDVKGAVVFHPWLAAPPATPTPTPSPTPSPTPTPTVVPGTRDFDLSPRGWHSFVWSGPDDTAPATVLSCIAGNYGIAYRWVGTTGQWQRYVPDQPTPPMSNMTNLNKYDALLVLITADAVQCQDMPVAP